MVRIRGTQAIRSVGVDDRRKATELSENLLLRLICCLTFGLVPVHVGPVGDGRSERDEPGVFRRIAHSASPGETGTGDIGVWERKS